MATDLQQLGQLLAQLLSESNRTLVEALTKNQNRVNPKIDNRALGGPPEWDSSKEDGFQEWNVKIKAWLVNQDPRAWDWMKIATSMTDVMETADLDVHEFPTEREREECKAFNSLLYNIVVTKLRGEAFNIVTSVKDGCGLEAWRLLMKRYEPRTPATKRALLKSIFNMKAAKKVEEIEKNLLRLEDIFTRYETMSNTKLPEDIKTVIMIELSTPDLKEHLEFNLKDMGYKETREAVMAYVERKRKDPLTAMEVGSHERDYYDECDNWWGGEHEENHENYEMTGDHEVNYYAKGYGLKGSGKVGGYGKGGGKIGGYGKGGDKGGGFGKGGGKGAGYGKGGGKDKGGGKGKGGGKKGEFPGNCHWCGKWGHTANRCSDKDAYMDWVRSGRGGSNAETSQEAYNLQSDRDEGWKMEGGSLSSLDKAPRFVDVCSLRINYQRDFPKLQNRFDSLQSEDPDVEIAQQPLKGPGGQNPVPAPRGSVKSQRGKWKKIELSHVGCDSARKEELNSAYDDEYLELTIDSGAGENVMSEHMAPKTPVEYSKEQDAGVVYTAANGEIMPNRGKKVLRVITKEGQAKAMNMQITDVNKALMSVAKICDAGHSVVFTSDGGFIKSNKTGEETKFRRENNVYRMKVKLFDEGFGWQG